MTVPLCPVATEIVTGYYNSVEEVQNSTRVVKNEIIYDEFGNVESPTNGHSASSPSMVNNGGKRGSVVASYIKVLFHRNDFDLKPEVQEMISYYDDQYLANYVAIDLGIVKDYEFRALKKVCEDK